MPDIFTRPSDADDPFSSGLDINVSTADHVLSQPCRGFYVGTGGNVRFTTTEGTTHTISVPSQSYHPWRVERFHQTGTTASGILAGW